MLKQSTLPGREERRTMAARTVNGYGRIQIFLSLLLCALTWRGPVPMLHHHDEFAGDTAAMQTHAVVFHPGSSGTDLQEWHWHFVVPATLPAGEPLSDRSDYPSDVICLACALAVCSEAGPVSQSCDVCAHAVNLPGLTDTPLQEAPAFGRTRPRDPQNELASRTCLRRTGVLLI